MTQVALTFDNLGEVTALQRGEWPPGEPLGRHSSVTRALPRLLGLLGELDLRATFFVEGLNTELYPDALVGLAEAGHEVAYHGWCHEDWASLGRDDEARLLERGVHAMDALGVRPVGFRPPGGELTPSTLELLAELGFTYCSPAGDEVTVDRDVAIVPFRWTLVDAFHYLPRFAAMRSSPEPASPAAFGAVLDDALHDGGRLTVVFHPFLTDPGERFDVLRAFLQAAGPAVAPARDIAERIRLAA